MPALISEGITVDMQISAHVTTADTRNASFDAIRPLRQESQQRKLYDLVLGAQRNGAGDMSMRELQQAYEQVHGKRIELSTVSSCCNALVAGKWLVRSTPMRQCCITGRDIKPLSVPAQQGRLVP